jgi:translin
MDLAEFLNSIRNEIDADDQVRERVLPLARSAVRKCSESIKQSHSGKFDGAKADLKEAHSLVTQAKAEIEKSQYLSKSRILDTAYQELAEAANVLSILEQGVLTPAEEYTIPSRSYLTGLADTVGEIRRAILEKLRKDETDTAEKLLTMMEHIFEELTSFDYPNALVPDLRRKCDVARGIIERTRGDVTTAVRQGRLVKEIGQFEERMKRE